MLSSEPNEQFGWELDHNVVKNMGSQGCMHEVSEGNKKSIKNWAKRPFVLHFGKESMFCLSLQSLSGTEQKTNGLS